MRVVIEYRGGGPLDGEIKQSSEVDILNACNMWCFALMVAESILMAKTTGQSAEYILKQRIPDCYVVGASDDEGRSHATTRYHVYEFDQCNVSAENGQILIRGNYRGVEE